MKHTSEWVVIAACFMLTLATGTVFATLTTFFTSFEVQFGWSRAQISLVQSASLVGGAISNLAMGWLTDRFGAKRPTYICAVIFGAGLALCSLVTSYPQLVFFYVIASLGGGANYVVPVTIVQRFVSQKRAGLALGLVVAGVSVSGLVFVPLAGILISSAGWQTAYLVLGIIAFGLIVAGTVLIPSRHEMETVMHNNAHGPDRKDHAGASGKTLKDLLRTRTFVIAAIMFMLPVFPNHMISVHIGPFAEGLGMTKSTAAGTIGLIGAFGVAGSILLPALSGRISWSMLVIITGAGAGLMLTWLTATSAVWMFYVFVVFYGFFYHGSSPVRVGLIRELFGTRSLASLMGILTAVSTMLAALGPPIAGFIYDHTGSYGVAFMIGALFWATCAALAFWLRKPVAQHAQASETAEARETVG